MITIKFINFIQQLNVHKIKKYKYTKKDEI